MMRLRNFMARQQPGYRFGGGGASVPASRPVGHRLDRLERELTFWLPLTGLLGFCLGFALGLVAAHVFRPSTLNPPPLTNTYEPPKTH